MKNACNKEYITSGDLVSLQESKEPSLFQVKLHNDDFTPMEFVVKVLEKFFFMDRCRAAAAMFEAHMNGNATCGVFSKDFAEAKINQVIDYAQLHEHPLICSMEAV